MARLVLGVSGASGVVLGYRCLMALAGAGHEVELVMTPHATRTAEVEMPAPLTTSESWRSSLPLEQQARVTTYSDDEMGAPCASGSHKVDGMLILPCSMATVASLACGLADTLLRRAADVTLKEQRLLVIVPRETPLSQIHLENLLRLSQRGVRVVPPVPAWYNHPKGLEDVEKFIVGRALDVLGVNHALYQPWQGLTLNDAKVSGSRVLQV